MFGQTFDLFDVFRLAALAFIEILLSADNAIILGILSHALPPLLRRRALYIGILSAFVLRALALIALSYILYSFWLRILGAAYLLYLSIGHFLKKKKKIHTIAFASFWKTVFLIEFFDLAFAIDSIVAGVAFIEIKSKLWIVYAGGMLGVLAIRYAADLFSHLINHLPRLESAAYLLIGWIGTKLALSVFTPMPETLFWIIFIVILAFGFLKEKKKA